MNLAAPDPGDLSPELLRRYQALLRAQADLAAREAEYVEVAADVQAIMALRFARCECALCGSDMRPSRN